MFNWLWAWNITRNITSIYRMAIFNRNSNYSNWANMVIMLNKGVVYNEDCCKKSS